MEAVTQGKIRTYGKSKKEKIKKEKHGL